MDPRKEYCLPTSPVSPMIPKTEEKDRVCLSITGLCVVSACDRKKRRRIDDTYIVGNILQT